MHRLIELVIVMVAVLTPQFLLASEIDGDEFAKATTGVAMAGVVVAAYKVYISVSQAAKRNAEEAAQQGQRSNTVHTASGSSKAA